MNSKIEELWNKAAASSAAYPSGRNNSWQTQVNFMNTFAELIIRECISLVNLRQTFAVEDELNAEHALDILVYDIEQHFGITHEQ